MGFARMIFRQGNFLGFMEKMTLREALALHAPDGDKCTCGEPVFIGDWQAWINHQYEVAFLSGRRQGPRLLE